MISVTSLTFMGCALILMNLVVSHGLVRLVFVRQNITRYNVSQVNVSNRHQFVSILENLKFYYIRKNQAIPLVGNYTRLLRDVGMYVAHVRGLSLEELKSFSLSESPIELCDDPSESSLSRLVYLISKLQLNQTFYKREMVPSRGPIRNPSIVKIHNRHLAFTAYPGYTSEEQLSGLRVLWINMSYSSKMDRIANQRLKSENYLNIRSDRITEFHIGYSIRPEDPRVTVISPEHLQVSYTMTFRRKSSSMGMSDLILNKPLQQYEIHNTCELYLSKNLSYYHYDKDTYHDINRVENAPQKNWAPFIYKSKIHYVYRIYPLVVVKPIENVKYFYNGSLYSYPRCEVGAVSRTIHQKFHRPSQYYWSLGEIRGGSNAILIAPDTYLGFFHSSVVLRLSKYRTYFMGAYSFSTKAYPFTLCAMSPFPIVGPNWYKERSQYQYGIDYVVFPMSLYMEGEDIILSVGWNNNGAYLLTFHLKDLLDSLEEVNKCPN